jgi:glyoxylase-like metal-dependent hydrolase (beta-lactamase superfamily II)
MKIIKVLMVCGAGAFHPAAATAQQPDNALASYHRARTVLDAAITAHGGMEALAAGRQIHVRMIGVDHWRNQSRAVQPPYDTDTSRVDLKIDFKRNRVAFDASMTFPGGARRAYRNATDSTQSVRLDHRAQTFVTPQWPPVSQQLGNLFYLPQFIVLAARENVATVRWLGRMKLSSGADVDVITAQVANGQLNLAFDPTTKLLRATVGIWSDALTGDNVQETEFVDYRMLNGVLLPTRRVQWVAGEKTRELTYVAAVPNYQIADTSVTAPTFYKAAPAPQNQPVRSLGEGVWLIGNPAVLAVAFNDHVVVVDAPPFGAADVLQQLATLAPGKPLRYIIPTHHHDDHAGGIKHFAAAGATVVTTPANQDYMMRMARARTTLQNDAPALAAAPKVELVKGKRVFTDGRRTLEVHDIGPGPHANEMLVAWLPQERVLFQGDLIEVAPDGGIARGANNETTVHFAEWLAQQRWHVQTYAGAHGTLRDPALFTELVQQPIIR